MFKSKCYNIYIIMYFNSFFHFVEACVKDGVQSTLGEVTKVTATKEKSERKPLDRMLRFSFCVIQCSVNISDNEHVIYEESEPNSVRKNRPLLEFIGDDNEKAAAKLCVTAIEMERQELQGKMMKITMGGSNLCFQLHFLPSKGGNVFGSSLGSGDGAEAGSRLFRHLLKNMSSRGSTYHALKDVLRLHWLYSSPRLQKLAKVSHTKYKCSLCNMEGHNRLSCPTGKLPSVEENIGESDIESDT